METFTVVPNPAKNMIYVRTNGKATLVLTEQSGKQVLTSTIVNSGTINVSSQSTGIYYLRDNAVGGQTKKSNNSK